MKIQTFAKIYRKFKLAIQSNCDDTIDLGMDMSRELLRYVEHVGSRDCCSLDIEKYIHLMIESNIIETIESFVSSLVDMSPELDVAITSESEMRRRTLMYDIDWRCNFPLLANNKPGRSWYESLIAILHDFSASLPLREGIDNRESGPSERMLISAIQLVFASSSSVSNPVSNLLRDKMILVSAILETGLQSSPHSALFKVPLVKTYALPTAAFSVATRFRLSFSCSIALFVRCPTRILHSN